MTTGTVLGIILIGLAAGVLSSMVGVGGGIIIVPMLVFILGFDQKTAAGTTLAMLSFPVSLVGAWTYYKNGMVDWKIAMILCIGFVIGGFFASKIAVNMPSYIIKRIFGVLMIVIAIKLLFFEKK